MMRLPLIVGFGGVGPAGRSSFHHAYRRTVLESIPGAKRNETLISLAALMGLARYENNKIIDADGNEISKQTFNETIAPKCIEGSLIRRLGKNIFDPDQVSGNAFLSLSDSEQPNNLVVKEKSLPANLAPQYSAESLGNGLARIALNPNTQIQLETVRALTVQSGGQLPTGFDPATMYNSRFHPRGLQLSIVAASDAVRSIGIDWNLVKQKVRPDEICVYAASAMGQLDQYGTGGMTQARLKGGRVSSKQLPLGLNQMPADFVNAYVLGNVGATGAAVGACATFLYNLRIAVDEIKSGKRRVAVVGNAEAPLLPEVIEGYAAMSALATDENLCKLDASSAPDYRRASRPFGENCGFVLAESGQYIVLFDDELAMELGANIHGTVTDVYVNADGIKKSISAPGPGNYITLAKAVASARAIFGDNCVKSQSFIQAHGSSTPQNRTTESRIFDAVAAAFGISNWPVTAVKAYLGHSLAPASADQMINTLGIFHDEILPGIKTIDKVADDVFQQRLNIPTEDLALQEKAEIGFLNSKGFGGNNATGVVASPRVATTMLKKRYGEAAFAAYCAKNESVAATAAVYDRQCSNGQMDTIYQFGTGMIDDEDVKIDERRLSIAGFDESVNLDLDNPFNDMV
ncbi:MAG: beta-ketoacyl synthase [Gammaproteobacteria bacterium]